MGDIDERDPLNHEHIGPDLFRTLLQHEDLVLPIREGRLARDDIQFVAFGLDLPETSTVG